MCGVLEERRESGVQMSTVRAPCITVVPITGCI